MIISVKEKYFSNLMQEGSPLRINKDIYRENTNISSVTFYSKRLHRGVQEIINACIEEFLLKFDQKLRKNGASIYIFYSDGFVITPYQEARLRLPAWQERLPKNTFGSPNVELRQKCEGGLRVVSLFKINICNLLNFGIELLNHNTALAFFMDSKQINSIEIIGDKLYRSAMFDHRERLSTHINWERLVFEVPEVAPVRIFEDDFQDQVGLDIFLHEEQRKLMGMHNPR